MEADREDDEEFDESSKKEEDDFEKVDFDAINVAFPEEDNGPINLADLRISLPSLPNDFDESYSFFE